MFKKVLANTIFQIAGKLVTATTTLLLTIVIGRSLGPSGYGDFTKVFVFIGYFYTLYDFGLNAIFVKLATKKEQSQGDLFKILLGLRLFLATSLALLSILIVWLLPYDANLLTGFSPTVKIGISLASLTIITQALITCANALFQKNLKYNLTVAATLAGSLAVLTISLIVFLTSKNLFGYIFSYIAGGIIFALVSLLLVFRNFKIKPMPKFDLESSKKLIKMSWPIGVALILNLIYFRADVLILSYSRTSQEVGYYGLSYQFFEAILTVPIFISNALFPPLARLFKENKESFTRETKFYFFWMLGISFILIIVLNIASLLIPYLYGTDFSPTQFSLQIMSIGLPFFFISALFWHLAIIFEKEKLLPLIYGLGAIFNVVANLIFIPDYGYLAAAAITVFAEILVVLLLTIFLIAQVKKTFDASKILNVK